MYVSKQASKHICLDTFLYSLVYNTYLDAGDVFSSIFLYKKILVFFSEKSKYITEKLS